MTMRKTIPDVYTEYEDGHLGVRAQALANVEAKIGAAKGGKPGQFYVFSGSDAKKAAKTIFKGGPLLHAIEEAFDAGSSTVYARRIGPALYAELTLLDQTDQPVLKLKAREPGTYWNKLDVQATYPSSPPQPGEKPTVIIRDLNPNPERTWTFTGATNEKIAEAINAGQSELEATVLGNGALKEVSTPVTLVGGNDGLSPTNADYLDGLDLTTGKPEIAWIHAVGAQSTALWAAILTHCDQMLENFNSERFAVLETPEFSSTAEPGSAQYLADLQDYVDDLVGLMETTANRNGVVFAGGAEFMDSDGERYSGPLASACGGVVASLEVQQSLINKQVKNILTLVPEFPPGQLQQLINARMNPVRLNPGRGFIIAHSLTAATPGSDYSRANDLRSVYYGGKAAREAAQPYVGEENDEEGEGLRRLESAMSRPLEVMRDGGQIDDFELTAISTPNDRLLGDVYVNMGIKPLRAMEMIYTKVYLT